MGIFVSSNAEKLRAESILRLKRVQELEGFLCRTIDGVRVKSAMTVYCVSPWREIETLYVEDDLVYASTCFPAEGGREIRADACRSPVCWCYADRTAAEAMIQWDLKKKEANDGG